MVPENVNNITLSPRARRRYILGKQGLWPGRRWSGRAGTAAAIDFVEAVQVDPVTVLAQSHDLALWGRVADYKPDHLLSWLYEERRFFDYGGGLFIYPMAELPYWRPIMEGRRSDARWARFADEHGQVIENVRAALKARGPLRKRDLDGAAVGSYRGTKDSGVALYYLWLTGELMTHGRQGKERIYAYLEDVAPADLQHRATAEAAGRHFARKTVAFNGLIMARRFRNGLRFFYEMPVDAKWATERLGELVDDGSVTAVMLEGEKEPRIALADDWPVLEALASGDIPAMWQETVTNNVDEVIFLSPLEYVSARGRAKKLFDFDYIWEIYKPAAKRRWGPYTLPILYGDQLVARLDAKYERATAELRLNGFWLEEWFAADAAFGAALGRGLARLQRFLGAETIDVATLPAALRKEVRARR